MPGKTPEWQNLDRIIDALERAGCIKNGYVNAPEDVVANAIRDWLRSTVSDLTKNRKSK